MPGSELGQGTRKRQRAWKQLVIHAEKEQSKLMLLRAEPGLRAFQLALLLLLRRSLKRIRSLAGWRKTQPVMGQLAGAKRDQLWITVQALDLPGAAAQQGLDGHERVST